MNNHQHYIKLSHSLQDETQAQLISIFQNLQYKGYINQKQKEYLIGPNPPHKNPEAWTVPFEVPQGHPIVSDCSSESYNSAQYIDHLLNPLSQMHDSYLKDIYGFIEKIKNKSFSKHAFVFTADVESLYTNIDTDLGLDAVGKLFRRFPDNLRPNDEILQLLKVNLTRNDFEFNGEHFLQVHRTAMGKKFAPTYANIYMADWEATLFLGLSVTPDLYFRYLDDIFGVWSQSPLAFEQFITTANNHHPTIKLTAQTHNDMINFLDTTVFFTSVGADGNKKLLAKIYFKPTDTHSLLHKQIFIPNIHSGV